MRAKRNLLLISAGLLAGILIFNAYFSISPSAALTEPADICLNEICSNNFSSFCSEDGGYYDFIELYNRSKEDVSLKNYTLTDEAGEYVFGDRTIPAKGYLLVSAAGGEKAEENADYAPFKISNQGESLILKDAEGKILDQVIVPADMKYDTSYARTVDGGGEWREKEASPQSSNEAAAEALRGILEKPLFSAESGFYEEPFFLELKAQENNRIYYTLDGSEPAEDSILYEKAIPVIDVSGNKNVYSARRDVSRLFLEEGNEAPFAVPEEPVEKAFVVRAAAFDENGNRSETVTKAYFIGFDKKKGYGALPVLSVVCAPEDLFGYEEGIYVLGKSYEEGIETGEDIATLPANYSNSGREWEREADIAFFGMQHELLMQQKSGIRIQGRGSRVHAQKSFKLYARKIYGGSGEFSFAFFGDRGKKSAVLFAGGDDSLGKLKDVLIQDLTEGCDFSRMENYPCALFLNGEYWGLYYLMERYGDDYLSETYHVPADGVIMIKDKRLAEGKDEDISYYKELMRFVEEADFKDEGVYDTFCEMVDIQSLIEYYAVEIYIARCTDWPGLNEGLWRTREKSELSFCDGKWRWMLYDTNTDALSSMQSDDNTLAYAKETSEIFGKLLENESFRIRFAQSFVRIADTVFESERVNETLDQIAAARKEPMGKFYKRYYGDMFTEEDFIERIEDLRVFFNERRDYIMYYMREEFSEVF